VFARKQSVNALKGGTRSARSANKLMIKLLFAIVWWRIRHIVLAEG
jgi:hypothetical protein